MALAAGEAKYREPFGPLPPGFVQIPFNDVEALAAAVDRDTAAVIFETVPATMGMPIPARGFYPAVREICDCTGALFIADEVQTGLGRTGRMWGVDCYGVVPDILVTAKGLSGGMYPISATCLRPHADGFLPRRSVHPRQHLRRRRDRLRRGVGDARHRHRPRFSRTRQRAGRVVRDRAEGLRLKHPRALAEVRQLGLFIGLRYSHSEGGPLMTKLCYDAGMFALYANNDHSVQQFLPPLVISDAEARETIRILDQCLGTLTSMLG